MKTGFQMEFRDLKKQYFLYKEEFDQAISLILSEGNFIGGTEVEQLEKELAAYVGMKHCITCANGTDALLLALMNWGVRAGDAVYIPDFTFFSTAEVVALLGATPVMVDIDETTFNLSAQELELAIERTISEGVLEPKVIIPVDLFGQPADFFCIRRIADKYKLKVLEDGAQGFGGSINHKKACGFGEIAATSFFPAKPLGCFGDGGALFTDCDEWEKLIRSYKVHGKGNNKYDNVRIGLNSRLDTIQAAVLRVKLSHFEDELRLVNMVAKWYEEKLGDLVRCPRVKEGYFSSWAQYTILLKDETERNIVQEKLRKNGIPSMIYYTKGMHMQEALQQFLKNSVKYPVTEKVCKRCLSLPMHPYMTKDEVELVTESIKSAVICL